MESSSVVPTNTSSGMRSTQTGLRPPELNSRAALTSEPIGLLPAIWSEA